MAVKHESDSWDIQGVNKPKQEENLGYDTLYSILSNERRRLVIELLAEKRERVDISDLAEQVACIEMDTTPDELGTDDRKKVYVSLYQCHLGTMDEAGVINYNKDRGWIDPGPHLEEVASQHSVAYQSNWELVKLAISDLLH